MTNVIKNKTWLDTHQWGVRAFGSGMKARYNGFQFKRGRNTCPDWNDKSECGGGFHLMTAEHNGFGFSGSLIRLVEYSGRAVALKDKIKTEKLRVVACSTEILETALRRCGVQVPQNGDEISEGVAVVLRGRPRITQSGGDLYTCHQSRPCITQSGGELRTCDQSQPRITQCGGLLRTYDQSQPRITQSGGDLYTCHQSRPRITQSGGTLYTCNQSRPRITQSGGELRTYDQSQPRITQSGGTLYTCDQSQPRITRRSA